MMKRASNIEKKHLISLGTCFGKFTKSGKFKMHITCLDYVAKYAEVQAKIFKSIYL
jgi:60S ribosome subunit biogenesis protein NIP7